MRKSNNTRNSKAYTKFIMDVAISVGLLLAVFVGIILPIIPLGTVDSGSNYAHVATTTGYTIDTAHQSDNATQYTQTSNVPTTSITTSSSTTYATKFDFGTGVAQTYGASTRKLDYENIPNPTLDVEYRGGSDWYEANGYLPDGWRFDKQYSFQGNIGTTREYDGIYNLDPDNYNDYKGKIIVTVRWGLAPESPPNGSIPQDLSYKVGQKVSDVKLPTRFYYIDPSATFDTMGSNKIDLIYNPNPNQYENYIVGDINVTVAKGDVQIPDNIPEINSDISATKQEVQDALPSGWYLGDDVDINFTDVRDYILDAYYTPSLGNYEIFEHTIIVHVYEATQSAPSEIPSFAATLGDKQSTLSAQLADFNAAHGGNYYYFDDYELDNNVFETLGTYNITIYYNTKPNVFAPWKGVANVYVDLHDAQTPDNIPELKSIFGANEQDLDLPSGWELVGNAWSNKPSNYNDNVDSGITVAANARFNPDKSKYKDYYTTVDISLTINKHQSSLPEQVLQVNLDVGQRYSDIDLPKSYSFVGGFDVGNIVSNTEGEFSVEVYYNVDCTQYYAIATNISITVDKVGGVGSVDDGYSFFKWRNNGMLNIPLILSISALLAFIAAGLIVYKVTHSKGNRQVSPMGKRTRPRSSPYRPNRMQSNIYNPPISTQAHTVDYSATTEHGETKSYPTTIYDGTDSRNSKSKTVRKR